jgi:23S rRNA (cytosine1962-C5)-methyltransferase
VSPILRAAREALLVTERLLAAKLRRSDLEADQSTNAYRLVNGSADGLEGLTLDTFDDVLVASLYEDLSEAQESALLEVIASALQPRSLYLKRRPREARVAANTEREFLAPDAPVYGEALEEIEILESGVKFLIRPGGDLSVGLFLDMRDTRHWLRYNISNRTALNSFAYTCGFGVVATLGGSDRAINLDLSRRVLDWGEANYRANILPPKKFDFISGDVFDWFTQLSRRGDTFGCVILDPPSFATSKFSRFSAASNYDELVERAVKLLEPDGLLLACCNHAKLERRMFLASIKRGLTRAGRGYNLVASLGQSEVDFPVTDDLEAPLKVFALEVA